MGQLKTIDYRELNQHLSETHLDPSAAEAHGMLCAMLCTDLPRAEESWVTEVLADADEAATATQECRRLLEDLAQDTRQRLTDLEVAFAPLLPDDASPLAERAHGLYDFSRGFLYGLGLAGIDASQLSDQAREVVDDLAAVTRIDLECLEESEDNEQALLELTEFVRVATMLVYEEKRVERTG